MASLEGLVRTRRAERPREEENDWREEDKKERMAYKWKGLGGQIRKGENFEDSGRRERARKTEEKEGEQERIHPRERLQSPKLLTISSLIFNSKTIPVGSS